MRSNIFLALGLGLALAGCQKEEASPASGPDAAAPSDQALARQSWSWRPWPFDPSSSHIELDPASGKVQLTSPTMFIEWFEIKLPSLWKGEFETTGEYNERIGNMDKVLDPLIKGSVYLFPSEHAHVQYDADKRVFRTFEFRCYDWESNGEQICTLGQIQPPTSEQLGKQFSAVIPRKTVQQFVKDNGLEINFECPVSSVDAPLIKDQIRFAYGYRFTSAEPLRPRVPSLDDRTYFLNHGLHAELALALCYDNQDGRVIAQQRYDKK